MLGIKSFDPVVNERQITAYGEACINFLKQWVLGKKVKLTFDTPLKDKNGRYLAYLSWDGMDINRLMVEGGRSMVYTEFPFAREVDYLKIEQEVRKKRRGIWGGGKAFKRILGWRREWAVERRSHSKKVPTDPFLQEFP